MACNQWLLQVMSGIIFTYLGDCRWHFLVVHLHHEQENAFEIASDRLAADQFFAKQGIEVQHR